MLSLVPCGLGHFTVENIYFPYIVMAVLVDAAVIFAWIFTIKFARGNPALPSPGNSY